MTVNERKRKSRVSLAARGLITKEYTATGAQHQKIAALLEKVKKGSRKKEKAKT